MASCLTVLKFLDEATEIIRSTGDHHEQGFVVCENNGTYAVGARCSEPGHHCTVKPPVCPKGGRAVVSFHTHSAAPTILDVVASEGTMASAAALVPLLPSSRDIDADADLGAEYGCIGGQLADGNAFLWCFRTFAGAPDRLSAKSVVQRLQMDLESLTVKNGAEREEALDRVLRTYLDQVRSPCLELRIPLD